MSDDDRLADYLARINNPNHVRALDDGCSGCRLSAVSCRCGIYMDLGPCCTNCSH